MPAKTRTLVYDCPTHGKRVVIELQDSVGLLRGKLTARSSDERHVLRDAPVPGLRT